MIAIVTGAFKMEENIRTHVGAVVKLAGGLLESTACTGRLLGPFAKAGKCKVEFDGCEAAAELKEGGQVKIILHQN